MKIGSDWPLITILRQLTFAIGMRRNCPTSIQQQRSLEQDPSVAPARRPCAEATGSLQRAAEFAAGRQNFRQERTADSERQHAGAAKLEKQCIRTGVSGASLTEPQHPRGILRPMNASTPPEDGSQVLSNRLSFVRRIKAYAMRAVCLPLVSLLSLIILSLAMSVALLASKEGVRSSRAQQHHDAHPSPQTTSSANSAKVPDYRNTSLDVRYVGSEACKTCHESEYEHYFQTPHGQAATLPTDRPELKSLPPE